MKLSPAAVDDLLETMISDIQRIKEDNQRVAEKIQLARDKVNKLLDDPDPIT